MTIKPRVKLSTTLGDIVIELNGEKAPITTMNFIDYVQDGYYAGTVFHRVMSNFMIQGGGYTADLEIKNEGQRPPIKNEWQNGLKNMKGSVAMARLSGQPDSARAQFFINVVDNHGLDIPRDGAGYAVFGKVTEGMGTVEKIRTTPVADSPKLPRMGAVAPVTTVEIKQATLLDKPDMEKLQWLAVPEIDRFAAKYEQEHNVKFTTTPSGLRIAMQKEGTGPTPNKTDKVTVHYRGTYLDGKEFDSSYSRNAPATFRLDQVIAGWTEGVGMMKAGGKALLVIPGNLAYGENPPGDMPVNATLFFEVELLSIGK